MKKLIALISTLSLALVGCTVSNVSPVPQAIVSPTVPPSEFPKVEKFSRVLNEATRSYHRPAVHHVIHVTPKPRPVKRHIVLRKPVRVIHPRVIVSGSDAFARLRQCESSGNYRTNTGNGFYGAYQFDLQTWHSNGGSGYPNNASPATQDRIAKLLQSRRGWQPWPACSRKLGLR